MKIVVDTNIVASAMFFGGRPRELLEMIVARKIDAYASPDIIAEYQETADELCSRFPDKPIFLPLTAIISAMKMVNPTSAIEICRDPDDNKFIECAVDAQCIYIVSGDKDLLTLGSYSKVRIVTVTEFLSELEN